jgi:DtxR family Mn-dependent transcriptional regulator
LLETPTLGGFLGGKLDFSWDEVHEIAEQLEHIKSEN